MKYVLRQSITLGILLLVWAAATISGARTKPHELRVPKVASAATASDRVGNAPAFDDVSLVAQSSPAPGAGVPDAPPVVAPSAEPNVVMPAPGVSTSPPRTGSPAAGLRLDVVPPLRVEPPRMRIPAIGLDAPLISVGLTPSGQMEAPRDADSVFWYTFSAEPGQPGNALFAGHVDLGARTAVFWRLRAVVPGDSVHISTGHGSVDYTVQRTYSVPSDTQDVDAIIGSRSGPSTLTLITCDGTFDAAKHAYNQRLIVVATAT